MGYLSRFSLANKSNFWYILQSMWQSNAQIRRSKPKPKIKKSPIAFQRRECIILTSDQKVISGSALLFQHNNELWVYCSKSILTHQHLTIKIGPHELKGQVNSCIPEFNTKPRIIKTSPDTRFKALMQLDLNDANTALNFQILIDSIQ